MHASGETSQVTRVRVAVVRVEEILRSRKSSVVKDGEDLRGDVHRCVRLVPFSYQFVAIARYRTWKKAWRKIITTRCFTLDPLRRFEKLTNV